MGVAIHYRLSNNKVYVKKMLDDAEQVAKQIKDMQAKVLNIPFKIKRFNDYKLWVDIGGCETLCFDFKSVKEIEEAGRKGWDYDHATLTDNGKKKLDEGYEIAKYPQNEIYYASGFCKTQYGSSVVEHKWVADLIKIVASKCITVKVGDEGDYYHSGVIDDAVDAIEQNGALISGLMGQLQGLGYDKSNIISGGETVIKKRKTKRS